MKRIYTLLVSMLIGGVAMAQTAAVTFQVDMSNTTVSPNGVHVAGDWQVAAGYSSNWDATSAVMTDVNSDGIYTLTVNLPAGEYQFKYINGSSWEDQFPLAAQLGGGNSNRYFAVGQYQIDNGMTLPAVTFNGAAPAGKVALKVSVDLQNLAAPDTVHGVHVAGDLTDPTWTPGFMRCSKVTGSVYAATLIVDADSTYQYKFINGDDWVYPNESVSGSCAVSGGNRTVTLGSDNMVIPTVCWNSCGPCTQPVSVTFQVDMSQQTVASTGLFVNGNFEVAAGGSADYTPDSLFLMTDPNSDNIYTLTVTLPPGTYSYKFYNGDWENVPSGCQDNNNNRGFTTAQDTVLPVVCYAQCGACVPNPDPEPITFVLNLSDTSNFPTDSVYVEGTFTTPNWQAGALLMTDVNGDGVYSVTDTVSGPAEVDYRFLIGNPAVAGSFTEENANFQASGCGVPNGIGAYNRLYMRDGTGAVLDTVCWNSCSQCGVSSGLKEVSFTGYVNIYPNPSSGNVSMTVQNPNGYQLSYSLYNITGKQVRAAVPINNTEVTIERGHLTPGIYFIGIQAKDHQQAMYKLILR